MNRDAWFRRLRDQLPGWFVWYWGTGGRSGTSGWYAAPVDPDRRFNASTTPTADVARRHPERVGPYPTPQELRAVVRRRQPQCVYPTAPLGCDGPVTFETDPFEFDVHDDHTKVWMCERHRDESAAEI